MELTAKDLIKRSENMAADRSTFESHWQEINDLLYPSGDTFVSTSTPGSKAHQLVFDNTGEVGAELLAATLQGLMTNPATKWFSVRAKNPRLNKIYAVTLYLENATRVMLSVFNSPTHNFAPQQHEKYLDLVNYGTAGMFIEERPGVGPLFQTHPLKNLLLAEDADGRIDTVYRPFELAARVAVEKFKGHAGEKVNKAARSSVDQDKKFPFLHCVAPRRQRDVQKLDGLNMPVSSAYVSVEDRDLLREGGFPEMPYVTPRWSKRSNEIYGRGRGMTALADVKMLQRSMKITIRGVEKVVDPSLQVADDGVMGAVRMGSNAINVVRADMMQWPGGGIRPINTGARPDLGEDFMAGIRKRIDDAFYKYLMQMFKDPRMTATQAIQISDEIMRVLGPVLGRLQTEDQGPMIDRTFAILFRAGAFGAPPEELDGEELEIEYVSPIARAQRLSEAKGISQTLDLIAPLAAEDPTVLDRIDRDKTFQHVADLFGWPKDTLRDDATVDKIRQARQETARQEAEKQDAVTAAQTGAKLIPALAQVMGGSEGKGAANAA